MLYKNKKKTRLGSERTRRGQGTRIHRLSLLHHYCHETELRAELNFEGAHITNRSPFFHLHLYYYYYYRFRVEALLTAIQFNVAEFFIPPRAGHAIQYSHTKSVLSECSGITPSRSLIDLPLPVFVVQLYINLIGNFSGAWELIPYRYKICRILRRPLPLQKTAPPRIRRANINNDDIRLSGDDRFRAEAV